MLLFDPKAKKLTALEHRQIESRERDIQSAIRHDPDIFFKEMGEPLMLIAEEVQPAELLGDSIDLLAIDPKGSVVVIELKRGKDKRQLLQAISYAGMISKWPEDQLIGLLAAQDTISKEAAAERLDEFLESSTAEDGQLNQNQRVILIAEDFDPAVLFAAEWLYERYGVDIRCYRLTLSARGADQYLNCTCIFPPPEITRIGRPGSKPPVGSRWKDWGEAVGSIENKAIADFFAQEIANGREGNHEYCHLAFRFAGKRRFLVAGKKQWARVYQYGRFDGDKEYWATRLSEQNTIQPKTHGHNLAFYLNTGADVEAFKAAIAGDVSGKIFSAGSDDEEPAD